MARDVFEKDPFGIDFADDAGNIGPQVAFVICAFALPRCAERLAGISGEDGVDCSPEGPSVKGGDIIPDRCRCEVSGALCGNDGLPWVFLPLDKGTGMETRLGKHEAHIKSSAACAEGKSVPGT